jgi:hypothetical protein
MSNYTTPIRIKRELVCPSAPKRPSFFEPVIEYSNSLEPEVQSKIDIVRNFLNYFPSGTFKHRSDVSDAVITELSCRCERISIDTCVYTKIY